MSAAQLATAPRAATFERSRDGLNWYPVTWVQVRDFFNEQLDAGNVPRGFRVLSELHANPEGVKVDAGGGQIWRYRLGQAS